MKHSTHVKDLPDVSRWLYWGIPAVVYPVMFIAAFTYPPLYNMMQRKEGLIEYLTVFVLVTGLICGGVMLRRYRAALPRPWLTGWFAFVLLAMFMFAGEEISWGQHLGLWTSEQVPAAIRAINDQDETNLHNISNALDQGPTNLIVGLTFLAFVFNPLFLRLRGETLKTDNPGYWFWPTSAGFFAALGVLIIPFPKRIYEWIHDTEAPNEWRHSEFHEFYVALLMATYIVSAMVRLKALHQRNAATPAQPAAATTR